MIKTKIIMAAIVSMLASTLFLTSCSKDGGTDTSVTKADFLGTYYGKHLILGLLPIGDTLEITDAPIGADSITIYSIALDASFNGKVTGYDVAFGNFVSDSLMFSETDTIYAKDIVASGSAKLQTNKTTFKTSLKVDAQVYNLQKVLPGQPSPKPFLNTALPGTFNKQ